MPTVHQTPGQHNQPPHKLRPTVAPAIRGGAESLPERTVIVLPQDQGDPASSRAAPPLRFLTIKEVISRTGFQKSYLYLRIKQKTFPPQIKVGRSARFVESEIIAIQRAWAIGFNPDKIRRLVADLISAR